MLEYVAVESDKNVYIDYYYIDYLQGNSLY